MTFCAYSLTFWVFPKVCLLEKVIYKPGIELGTYLTSSRDKAPRATEYLEHLILIVQFNYIYLMKNRIICIFQ